MKIFQNKILVVLFFIAFSSLIFFSQKSLAANEICAGNASCCQPPTIVQAGGGCPTGTYWIGSESDGNCDPSSVTCTAPSSFNCATGACTSISTPGTGCPGWQLNLGNGNCVDVLKIIKDTNQTILKIYNGGEIGNIVYIPKPVACVTGSVPVWNDGLKTWSCSIDDWTKNSISNFVSYVGKVAINIADPGALWQTYVLYVKGDANIDGKLNVTGDTTIGGNLEVKGDTKLKNLNVTNNAIFNNITVTGETSGIVGKFIGFTPGSYTGNLNGGTTGYKAANDLCKVSINGVTGGHICTAPEIINSYNLDDPKVKSASGVAWINVGAPTNILLAVMDCRGWKDNYVTKSYYGNVWNFTTGTPSIKSCDASRQFACCK